MTTRWRWFSVLVVALAAGCATGAAQPAQSSLLDSSERVLLGASHEGAGFSRFWRLDPAPSMGLVKWDVDNSGTRPGVPRELLQSIRDELGRVNQAERRGVGVVVAVRLEEYETASFWRRACVRYEITGRTSAGTLLWVVQDNLHPRGTDRASLADSDELVLARGIVGKLLGALRL